MKNLKKVISIVTLVFTVLTALYLICMLFGAEFTKTNTTSVLVPLASLAVGGFFAINSVDLVKKNKIIGWVSFALIALSVVLIDILMWTGMEMTFLRITMTFAMLSVIFTIIVSLVLTLGRKYLTFQIILYVLLAITFILSALQIFGVIEQTVLIIVFVIVDVVCYVILNVFSKKSNDSEPNSVTISKTEYEELKEKAKKYDEIMSNTNKN